jgi:hypothetical protein
VVVIPAYKEEDILPTLHALTECELTDCVTEVCIIINEPDDASPSVTATNARCYEACLNWSKQANTKKLIFHATYKRFPKKKHGVGLARKVGMDEAVRRFNEIGNLDGVIVGLDADSSCSTNYLSEIECHFKNNPGSGASIYYEHPFTTSDTAIIQYELHLRYFVHAQRFAGFPTYQTVGSSMAVSVDAYVKQGGMNTRKAGEDFYFLTRIMKLNRFSEIKGATVYPSSRVSDRVPFGTGRAMSQWKDRKLTEYQTYNIASFIALKSLVPLVQQHLVFDDLLEKTPSVLQAFLNENFHKDYERLRAETSTKEAFIKGFNATFDHFMIMKYVHYARNTFPDTSVQAASTALLNELGVGISSDRPEVLLEAFRSMDKR